LAITSPYFTAAPSPAAVVVLLAAVVLVPAAGAVVLVPAEVVAVGAAVVAAVAVAVLGAAVLVAWPCPGCPPWPGRACAATDTPTTKTVVTPATVAIRRRRCLAGLAAPEFTAVTVQPENRP